MEKCFAIRLPNITKDDENNYNLNYNTIKIKKRIEKGTHMKHILGEIFVDMCNIMTHKGIKIRGDLIVDDLPENEILLISFDQFSIQHKYIEYLRKSKDKKINELESIISKERSYIANLRNAFLYIYNLLGQQIAFINNHNMFIPANDTKRIKLSSENSETTSNCNSMINT